MPTGFPIDASAYTLAQALFLRALGLVYFCAFFSLLTQVKGLYGEHGILPIRTFIRLYHRLVDAHRTRALPSLFWFGTSDRTLVGACVLGVILSLLLMLGIAPAWMILGLTLLYLSFINAGQDFLSFQWDTLLLEVSYISFFFALTPTPSPWILLAFWALLFRFMISAGVVKLLSGDINWRSLSALTYHYESQPLPNSLSWYFHQLPAWFQKISTLVMFALELLVPFFIFGPAEARLIAFALLAGFQVLLALTGNLSFLNLLTLTLCLPLLPNTVLQAHLPDLLLGSPSSSPAWLEPALMGVGLFFIGINALHTLRFFFFQRRIARILSVFTPLHMTSSYGLFAVMTTDRLELEIQGSEDGHHWKPYEFKYKPQNPFQAPRQIAPFHPRLDWQMWFAALRPGYFEPWLNNFLSALLKGSADVLKLLKSNPFPQKPPRYVRVAIYSYAFTDIATKRAAGPWWERKLIEECSAVELSEKSG